MIDIQIDSNREIQHSWFYAKIAGDDKKTYHPMVKYPVVSDDLVDICGYGSKDFWIAFVEDKYGIWLSDFLSYKTPFSKTPSKVEHLYLTDCLDVDEKENVLEWFLVNGQLKEEIEAARSIIYRDKEDANND